jgi:hypothetical protein
LSLNGSNHKAINELFDTHHLLATLLDVALILPILPQRPWNARQKSSSTMEPLGGEHSKFTSCYDYIQIVDFNSAVTAQPMSCALLADRPDLQRVKLQILSMQYF